MNPYPLYAPDQLLPALRDYLIAQGIVRKPSDTTGLSTPPAWLDPKRGVPYPGQTQGVEANESHPTMVLGIFPGTGIPSQPFEGFLVQLAAVIWYRGKTSPAIQTIHERIRGVLHDRRNINMEGLLVNQAMLTREIQRIGSDETGYTYNTEYMFDLWNPNYTFTP